MLGVILLLTVPFILYGAARYYPEASYYCLKGYLHSLDVEMAFILTAIVVLQLLAGMVALRIAYPYQQKRKAYIKVAVILFTTALLIFCGAMSHYLAAYGSRGVSPSELRMARTSTVWGILQLVACSMCLSRANPPRVSKFVCADCGKNLEFLDKYSAKLGWSLEQNAMLCTNCHRKREDIMIIRGVESSWKQNVDWT